MQNISYINNSLNGLFEIMFSMGSGQFEATPNNAPVRSSADEFLIGMQLVLLISSVDVKGIAGHIPAHRLPIGHIADFAPLPDNKISDGGGGGGGGGLCVWNLLHFISCLKVLYWSIFNHMRYANPRTLPTSNSANVYSMYMIQESLHGILDTQDYLL